jgi:hypothetical protein
MDRGNMHGPEYAGDQSDAGLDAKLAAAEDRLLAAIRARLDLDAGLAEIIGDPRTVDRQITPAHVTQPFRKRPNDIESQQAPPLSWDDRKTAHVARASGMSVRQGSARLLLRRALMLAGAGVTLAVPVVASHLANPTTTTGVAYLILAVFFVGFWLGVVAMVAIAIRREDRRYSLSGAAPAPAARGARILTRFGGAGSHFRPRGWM